MNRKLFLSTFFLFLAVLSSGQNFSNKGKLFWVGHAGHIQGTGSSFALYITTENASGAQIRVSIPGGTFSQNYTIPFNQIVVVSIPSTQSYINCTDCIQNRGVKIESFDNDIVVYAHIYNMNRSDATLLIPVETWGKEYFAMAYDQNPVSSTQRSQFMVIASEDSTFVDIYPTQDILPSKPANVKYTIMLNAGQVYQGQSNVDVTGTRIVARSADGKSCKYVAAFSGSTFTRLGCPSASTGDNLYKQLFPTTSWGREFLTVPLKTRNGDQYRILARDDSTFVTINGGVPVMINRAGFYTYYSATPGYITSDKPITLAQYPRSQNCDNVTGDPTMILIPPIEQMVKNVTMYSSPYQNITGQYLNIITRSINVSRFRLDGSAITFSAIPANTNYAFAQETVSAGVHRMVSDSNFQVVAYGFGNLEAYGYAGGTNIKNLTQSIGASADYLCLGDTVFFRAEVNYVPTFKKWYFGDGTWDTVNYNPKHVYAQPGEYLVSLVTHKDGLVDCSSIDSTIYRIKVRGYPTANFELVSGTCQADTFVFNDLSTPNHDSVVVNRWNWYFSDTTQANGASVQKKYNRNQNVQVTLVAWNNGLCPDTVVKQHFINPHPGILLIKNDTCPGYEINFQLQNSIASGSIVSNDWLIDSIQADTGLQVSYSSLIEGSHFIDLKSVSDSGCVTIKRENFQIYPLPEPLFSAPNHCYGSPLQVRDSSLRATLKIWDYTDTLFVGAAIPYVLNDTGSYSLSLRVRSAQGCWDSAQTSVIVYPLPLTAWKSTGTCREDRYRFEPDFDSSLYASGDFVWLINGSQSNGPSKEWVFPTAGNNSVSLRTYTSLGCTDIEARQIFVNPHPQAAIMQNDTCPGYEIVFSDQSTVSPGGIAQVNWLIDGTHADSGSTISYTTGVIGNHTVQITVTSDSGCVTSRINNFVIYNLPEPKFIVNNHCYNSPMPIVDQSENSVAWHWNYQDTSFTGTPASYLFQDTGIYTIQLKTMSVEGCFDSLSKQVEVYPLPLSDWQRFGNCQPDKYRFEPSFDSLDYPLSNYFWTIAGTNYTGPSQELIFPTYGLKNINLRVRTSNGCEASSSSTVFVNPLPIPQPVFTAACEGELALFTDQSNYMGSRIFVREWTYGTTNYTDSQFTLVPSPTYNIVSLRVVTDSSCEASTAVNVFSYPLPQADFTTLGECPQDSITQQDLSLPPPFDTIDDWYWTVQGHSSGNQKNHTWLPMSGGDYPVLLIVKTAKGCYDTTSQAIHVLDVPQPKVTEFPACIGFLAELEDSTELIEHGIVNWNWQWDGANYSGKRVGEVFTKPGYYPYSLDIVTDRGCEFFGIVKDSIYIADKPKVAFSVDRQMALLDNAIFNFTNRTDNAVSFVWNFGDGNSSTLRSTSHIYTDTGLYEVQLWAENSYGCSDSTTDTIRVRPMLECFIPNAITPNYDRLNENFGPVCEGLMDFEMRIYNRWGQEVFVTTQSEQWNPYKHAEDNFQSGIYMYVIKARDYLGDPKFFSGSFILIQ